MTLYHFHWGDASDELQLAFHIKSADYMSDEEFESELAEATAFMDGFVSEREWGPCYVEPRTGWTESRPAGMTWRQFRQLYVVEGKPAPF